MPKAFPQEKRGNSPWTPLQRRTWLAERRRRSRCLLPAPVLVAAYPDLAVWTWDYPDPAYWYAYHQHAEGEPFTYDDRGAGTDRQYAPDGGQYPMFIVGCDASGNEITERSNAVRPEDAQPPAPVLVSLGKVLSETTWRAVAPVAVNGWQFCTTDSVFDPEVKSFDQWVEDADGPDTEFTIINATTATVTVDFAYCAARYLVGTTWSDWTGVLDATVIPPPGQLVEPTLAFVGGYFQGTAPVPASVWQFAQSDSVYESGSVQSWVDGADQSNADYGLLPPNQAQSGRMLSYCTCRYQVAGVWSPSSSSNLHSNVARSLRERSILAISAKYFSMRKAHLHFSLPRVKSRSPRDFTTRGAISFSTIAQSMFEPPRKLSPP